MRRNIVCMAAIRSLLADTRPLRSAAFKRMWLAYIVTVIGAQFTVVAVPAQIYADTHSSGYVGLTGICALVPLIVFGLWGGALADHFDRRRLLIVTTVGIILTSAAFFVVTALNCAHVWLLLAVFAIQQGFFAVNSPVRTAILPQIVPREILPSANALNITVTSVGGIAGPLIGGMLIPLVGIKWLYLADVFFLLPTLAAVIALPPLKPSALPAHRSPAGGSVAGEDGTSVAGEDSTESFAVAVGETPAQTLKQTAPEQAAGKESAKAPAPAGADERTGAASRADAAPVPGIAAIVDGLRYLRGRTILVMSFAVDLIAMIFGSPRALFPQISHESFGGDPNGGLAFGLLYAAIPAGAALGGLFSGWLPKVRRQGRVVMIAIWCWGAGVLIFGASASLASGRDDAMGDICLAIAVAALAAAGAADMCSSALRNVILLTETDDALRGRLQSIFFVVVVGGPRIADALHGSVAEFIGAPGASMVGALCVLVGIGICVLAVPRFWRYETPQ